MCNTIASVHNDITTIKLNPCSISVVCLTSVYISIWKEKRIGGVVGCGGMVAATLTLSPPLSSLSSILSTLSILWVLSVLSIPILSFLSLYSVFNLSSVLWLFLFSFILYSVTEFFLVSVDVVFWVIPSYIHPLSVSTFINLSNSSAGFSNV